MSRRRVRRSPNRPTTPQTTDVRGAWAGARAPRGYGGPARRDGVEPVGAAHQPDRFAADRARAGARPRARLAARGTVVRAGAVQPAPARAGDVRARRTGR